MSDAPTPQTPTTEADAEIVAETEGDAGRAIADIPAGQRVSANVELLVIEAELVAEGKELQNPARPDSEQVTRELMSRLEPRGVEPAWAVMGDE